MKLKCDIIYEYKKVLGVSFAESEERFSKNRSFQKNLHPQDDQVGGDGRIRAGLMS